MTRKILFFGIVIVAAVVLTSAIILVPSSSDDVRAFVDDDRLGETLYLHAVTTADDGTIVENYCREYVHKVTSSGIVVCRGYMHSSSSDGYSLSTGLLTRHLDEDLSFINSEYIDSPLFGVILADKYSTKDYPSPYNEYVWVYDGMVLQWTEDFKKTVFEIDSASCFDEQISLYDVTVRSNVVPGDFIGYTYFTGDDKTYGESHSTALVVLSVNEVLITAQWTHSGEVVYLSFDDFLMGGITPIGEPQEDVLDTTYCWTCHRLIYDNCEVWSGGVGLKIFKDGIWFIYVHSSLVNGTRSLSSNVVEDYRLNYTSYFVMVETDTSFEAGGLSISRSNDFVEVESRSYVRYYSATLHDTFDYTFKTSYRGTVLSSIVMSNYPTSVNYDLVNTQYGELRCMVVNSESYGFPSTIWISEKLPGLVVKMSLYDGDRMITFYLEDSPLLEAPVL